MIAIHLPHGDLDFEDTLHVVIEFDHVLSKSEAAKIRTLYASWAKRIESESRKIEDEYDGSQLRVDALFVGDKAVTGGASRFIAADKANVWLVGEVKKLKGVTSIVFGDPPDDGKPLLAVASPIDETPPAAIAKLEPVGEKKVRAAALSFSLAFYTDKPLQKSAPGAVLTAWHEFLDLGARGRLKVWGTETTAPIDRKPVTETTLGLLDKWLQKGAAKRPYLAFMASDAASTEQGPRWKFEVWSVADEDEDAHAIRISLPIRFGLERADDMVALARKLFATGAFRSGIAGPCWECGIFSAYRELGNAHLRAVALASKYPAIDLANTLDDVGAIEHDGIQNVGWLTMLDKRLAADVDITAVRQIAGVTVEGVGKGVMIRAGATPTLEGKLERRIFEHLSPLVARTTPRLASLSIEGSEALHTFAFKMRLGDVPELAVISKYAGCATALLEAAQKGKAAEAKTQLKRCLEAIAKLRAMETDDEGLADVIKTELAVIEENIGYAGYGAKPALAFELLEAAVKMAAPPAELYGKLQIRDNPYVLSGLIPAALAIKNKAALNRHVDAAAKRASESPAIHHALARAFVFLGETERAIDHVELAQSSYGDAKELKTDKPLAPLAKNPRFVAAFRVKNR